MSELYRARNTTILEHARSYLVYHGRLTISAVTVYERSAGHARVRHERALRVLDRELRRWEVLPCDHAISRLAGELDGTLQSRGLGVGRADAMIAATAILQERTLITNNTRHFVRLAEVASELGHSLAVDNWLGA
ncbi:MAG: type II toxin-antitoxin system VapC family toxin [Deltaproteobacteria bacterium]|nr:type II toxin-antitoxin system VapC family toxin [Deltaproteobacteria bacterium]